MPLLLFEALCVAVIALTLVAMARSRPPRQLIADYLALALAAWIGEQSCVALYRFYAYAPGWHARLGHVPLLVPLIWPLVILSAQAVARSLWPDLSSLGRALVVGAVVTFDASLVEVLAVRAGLWSWAEPGHLGVPLAGILGWGWFAMGAEWALSRPSRWRHALTVVLAPLVAHALIVGSWWVLLRWVLRGDLRLGSTVAVAILGASLCLPIARVRQAGRAIPLAVALPRMIAASLFVALLLSTAPGDGPLWIHTIAVAVPYLAATRFTAPAARQR